MAARCRQRGGAGCRLTLHKLWHCSGGPNQHCTICPRCGLSFPPAKQGVHTALQLVHGHLLLGRRCCPAASKWGGSPRPVHWCLRAPAWVPQPQVRAALGGGGARGGIVTCDIIFNRHAGKFTIHAPEILLHHMWSHGWNELLRTYYIIPVPYMGMCRRFACRSRLPRKVSWVWKIECHFVSPIALHFSAQKRVGHGAYNLL